MFKKYASRIVTAFLVAGLLHFPPLQTSDAIQKAIIQKELVTIKFLLNPLRIEPINKFTHFMEHFTKGTHTPENIQSFGPQFSQQVTDARNRYLNYNTREIEPFKERITTHKSMYKLTQSATKKTFFNLHNAQSIKIHCSLNENIFTTLAVANENRADDFHVLGNTLKGSSVIPCLLGSYKLYKTRSLPRPILIFVVGGLLLKGSHLCHAVEAEFQGRDNAWKGVVDAYKDVEQLLTNPFNQ